MKKLQSYAWPGNIRELSNMIERAVIRGTKIRFPELEGAKARESLMDSGGKLKDLERKKILGALRSTGGKVGGKDGAASLLGLNRTTLIHRMKKLGIKVKQDKTVLDSVTGFSLTFSLF